LFAVLIYVISVHHVSLKFERTLGLRVQDSFIDKPWVYRPLTVDGR